MTRRKRYDADDNSRKSFSLALACIREKHIRAHAIQPRPDNEMELRWSREGSVPESQLESLRREVTP